MQGKKGGVEDVAIKGWIHICAPAGKRSMLQANFGTHIAQVFAHAHAMFMLPQQFPANYISIFGHNSHQPVIVFGVISYQLGQVVAPAVPIVRAARPFPSWDWLLRFQT